jgi:thermostable 8-oxoguanine DNA glycosylase
MVDPINATDYHRSIDELEEFLLFCIAVAGKHAGRTAINLEKLFKFTRYPDESPFYQIQDISEMWDLPDLMKSIGFGCFNIKAKGLLQAANSGLDLRKCTVEDLESLYGVGMKTARYFILHSRKNAEVACLDTHVLKWLSYYTGYEVPDHTPTKKKYLELERIFLKIAETMKISPAALDLKIWNKQRGTD